MTNDDHLANETGTVVCASCGARAAGGACGACGADPRLAGRYRLIARLGEGATGETFMARDDAGAQVVVKLWPASVDQSPQFAQAYRARAKALAKGTAGTRVARVRELLHATHGGMRRYWLVRDVVEGETLAAKVARGERWDVADSAALASRLLDAVGTVHALADGVRANVKPSNVMLDADREPTLLDLDLTGPGADDDVSGDLRDVADTVQAVLVPVGDDATLEPIRRVLARMRGGDARKYKSAAAAREAVRRLVGGGAAARAEGPAGSPARDPAANGHAGRDVGEGRRLSVREANGVHYATDLGLVYAVDARASSEFGEAWAARKVTGKPNVFPRYGDDTGAWAPLAADGGIEWLEVDFPAGALPATGVAVFETCGAGAVYAVVDASDPDAPEVLYQRQPSRGREAACVLVARFASPRRVTTLRLWLDTKAVDDWNEIDAVALVTDGSRLLDAVASREAPAAAAPAATPAAAPAPALAPGERVIEMTWRCSSCRRRNLGRHAECAECGSPKDGSEAYEMPSDTASASSVTDAGLLAIATGGANWRCGYCGSDQRRADDACARCGASASSGAEVTDGAAPGPGAPYAGYDDPARVDTRPWYLRPGRLEALAALVVALVLGGAYLALRPRNVVARVASTSWERVIHVERYRVWRREGFAENRPADAFDVASLGQRVHHHEQVFDHYDTEYYSVQVPDGYRTESYTARVACGQDCTTTPQSCSERCTSNRNGFATCRTVCSGGGQRCSTRYCSESRTRQVQRYRTEQRSRQVPRYRSEPRYAEAFAWSVWDWGHDRTVRAAGSGPEPPRWPEAEARVGANLAQGERERERREERYRVVLRWDRDRSHELTPSTPEEFARYAVGSDLPLRVSAGGRVQVLQAGAGQGGRL